MTDPRPAFPPGTILGYPRIGRRRELKRAVEAHWARRASTRRRSSATAAELRRATRERLAALGLGRTDSSIPESFSYYDQVLDAAVAVGALPERFADLRDADGVDRPRGLLHRRARRGRERAARDDEVVRHELPLPRSRDRPRDGVRAVERPLRASGRRGEGRRLHRPPRRRRAGDAARARQGDGCRARRASIRSAASTTCCRSTSSCSPSLRAAGAEWVQLDEPALVSESLPATPARARGCRGPRLRRARRAATTALRSSSPPATHSSRRGVERARGRADRGARDRPDPRRGARAGGRTRRQDARRRRHRRPQHLARRPRRRVGEARRARARSVRRVGRGRHVDVAAARAARRRRRDRPRPAAARRGSHSPIRRSARSSRWPAASPSGRAAIEDELAAASAALADRAQRARRPRRRRARARGGAHRRRTSTAATYERARRGAGGRRSDLPVLPTTTIGSFPQTGEIRRARARHDQGEISTERVRGLPPRRDHSASIGLQEELGLDVLVHGEAERNDMVQYFAENLDGFAVTRNGWVQSYGSRATRPSILWGDVSRPAPITVAWSRFAQSLTEKPVKGMLTGPVTILAWSFVRDDQPLGETANQVALALRDEIARPRGRRHRRSSRSTSRRCASCCRSRRPTRPPTSTGRSDRSASRTAGAADADAGAHPPLLLGVRRGHRRDRRPRRRRHLDRGRAQPRWRSIGDIASSGFAHGIGPGVYDIHSPRVPSVAEVTELLERADRRDAPSARCGSTPTAA